MIDDVEKKLDDIVKRLDRIENKKETISEERTEVAEHGKLESEETFQQDEAVVTTKKIPYCFCGNKLDEFTLCNECEKVLCSNCSINYRNKVYCPEHLNKRLPSSRTAFKVNLCIANKIDSIGDIQKITGIPKGEIENVIAFLKKVGYVEISWWQNKKTITDFGLESIMAWSQFEGGTAEMKQLDIAIMRHHGR